MRVRGGLQFDRCFEFLRRAASRMHGQTRSGRDADLASIPANLVPKSVVKAAVADFTAADDRPWRTAMTKVLRDERERKWNLPLGVSLHERIGPRGVQWMILHDDPFVAEWIAQRLEKRLQAGSQDASFVLRNHDDAGKQVEDAGLTIVAAIWVVAPANSKMARWQMGRILLAVLHGIQRSTCDGNGRLSLPAEASTG